MRMPWRAATPVPTMMAVGVASPSAQGQAITSTETAAMMASDGLPVISHQAMQVSTATATTMGTKIDATRSTRRRTGALLLWADCTSLMMPARVDSAPTDVASMRIRPFAVDGATDDIVARGLRDRQALAGEQRLVHLTFAVADATVHRDAFAGAYDHPLAPLYRRRRYLHLFAITQYPRPIRAQTHEGANRLGGAVLGACFQPTPQQHQSNDGSGRFEIKMCAQIPAGPRKYRDAETVRGAGAYHHQQVHVGHPGAQALDSGHIESQAGPELHWCRQHQLQPSGQHGIDAHEGEYHLQDQGKGEDGTHQQAVSLPPGEYRHRLIACIGGRGTVGRAGAVTRLLQGRDQFDRCRRTRDDIYLPLTAGEVDPRLDDAGHVSERLFHTCHAGRATHARNREVDAGDGD